MEPANTHPKLLQPQIFGCHIPKSPRSRFSPPILIYITPRLKRKLRTVAFPYFGGPIIGVVGISETARAPGVPSQMAPR